MERYLAGALSEAESAQFEAHFLTCRACQQEVRLGTAIREGLSSPARQEPRFPRRFGLAAGGLLAAGLAGFLLLDTAVPPEIASLGRLQQPPIYLGVAVRGQAGEAEELFDAAMLHYRAGRYGEAADGLRDAIGAGFDQVPARFFLGSALLASGEPRGAADEYRAVIARGETPYRAESHYYLAKALLQRGEVSEARAQLRLVSRELDGTGEAARELLQRLEGVEPR